MINESKLNLMYDLVIENGSFLSTKTLKEIGLISYDLNKLLENNILFREKRGVYKFNDIEGLFSYGKALISKEGANSATKCFERCYEIDKNHSGACFQLFLRTIENEDYENAIIYFDVLDKNQSRYYRKDYNFYLCALNFLTTLPDNYKKRVQKFRIEDILIYSSDKRYQNIERHNKIRAAVFNQKFYCAATESELLTKNQEDVTVQDIITKDISKNLSRNSYKRRKKLYDLAKMEAYKEIIETLKKKEIDISLTFDEFVIKKLAEKLVLVKEKKEIFNKFNTNTYGLIVAIENNDFIKAFKNREYFCKKMSISQNEDIISFMLNDLIELAEIKAAKREENDYSCIIEDIKYFFEHKKWSTALNLISDLLYELNMKHYEQLAHSIVKLDILESYQHSNRTIKFITGLVNNEININIKEFIDGFIISLARNEKRKSELYLNILEISNNLLKFKLPITEYYKVLNNPQNIEIDDNLIEEKHREMTEYGIAILENITLDKLAIIGQKLEKYKDINLLYYAEDGLNLILRNKLVQSSPCDEFEIVLGDKAYENQDYEKSLNHYLRVLCSKHAKASTYAKLGFIYYKLGNSKKALEYFKVAKAISKDKNIIRDYETFIEVLSDQINYDELMLNSNDNFGLGDVKDITDFIVTSELDIESACSLLRLNEDETKILMLVYAKDFYSEGNLEKGDELLNEVLQKENNSLEVRKLINFLIRNKNFYLASEDSELRKKRV